MKCFIINCAVKVVRLASFVMKEYMSKCSPSLVFICEALYRAIFIVGFRNFGSIINNALLHRKCFSKLQDNVYSS